MRTDDAQGENNRHEDDAANQSEVRRDRPDADDCRTEDANDVLPRIPEQLSETSSLVMEMESRCRSGLVTRVTLGKCRVGAERIKCWRSSMGFLRKMGGSFTPATAI